MSLISVNEPLTCLVLEPKAGHPMAAMVFYCVESMSLILGKNKKVISSTTTIVDQMKLLIQLRQPPGRLAIFSDFVGNHISQETWAPYAKIWMCLNREACTSLTYKDLRAIVSSNLPLCSCVKIICQMVACGIVSVMHLVPLDLLQDPKCLESSDQLGMSIKLNKYH